MFSCSLPLLAMIHLGLHELFWPQHPRKKIIISFALSLSHESLKRGLALLCSGSRGFPCVKLCRDIVYPRRWRGRRSVTIDPTNRHRSFCGSTTNLSINRCSSVWNFEIEFNSNNYNLNTRLLS